MSFFNTHFLKRLFSYDSGGALYMQFLLTQSLTKADICSGCSCTLYLCQINSDLYETLNTSFWGPNWLIPLILTIPVVLSIPSGTLWSPSGALYIPVSLPNQPGSLWDLKLKLLGSNLVDPIYFAHPLCLQVPYGTLHKSPYTPLFLYVCQIKLDLY